MFPTNKRIMEKRLIAPKLEPKPMAELAISFPDFCSGYQKEVMTERKQQNREPNETMSNKKSVKLFTPAEMQSSLQALRPVGHQTPSRRAASTTKKNWNSSVKLMNRETKTDTGKIKKSVRKSLFNHNTQVVQNLKSTNMQAEAPVTQKQEMSRIMKMPVLDCLSTKANGTSIIQKNPKAIKQNKRSLVNKEHISVQSYSFKQLMTTPKNILRKQTVLDTPLTNISSKFSDASFLQIEKEIDKIEKNEVRDKQRLEKMAIETPPTSTPFKEYRDVVELINNSDILADNESLYNDNTLMNFSNTKQKEKRNESDIVSLCNLLEKTTMTHDTKLETLLLMKQKLEENSTRLESTIEALMKNKESLQNSLQMVNNLLLEAKEMKDVSNVNNNLIPNADRTIPENKNNKRMSVIKYHSPSYKIPKKTCVQKKIVRKSFSNNSAIISPEVGDNKALKIYMNMKKEMNFLNTPKRNNDLDSLNTPAKMSLNLQSQLNKLYN